MQNTVSQAWLDYESTHGGRFTLSGTAEEIIAQVKQLSAIVTKHQPTLDGLLVESKLIGGVPVRIYTPLQGTQERDVFLFSHGGGFIAGDLDSEHGFCQWIAKAVNVILISIGYRLGPEWKLPVMLDDVVSVFEEVRRPENGYVKENTDIFAMGGSAGGALSLALGKYATEQSSSLKGIKGVVALAPVALHPDNVPKGYEEMYTSYGENVDVPVMGASAMRVYLEAVNAKPGDGLIFTALGKLDGFPPTYVVTCGLDPLRDDGLVLVKRLQEAGARVQSDHYDGLPHIFWVFEDFEMVGEFKEKLLRGIEFVRSG